MSSELAALLGDLRSARIRLWVDGEELHYHSPTGLLPPALAERFIDTEQATHSALRVFQIAQTVLSRLELQLLDACFLFDESGRVLCYEVSPDNMRIKRASWSKNPEQTAEFDKDLWRDGADPALLIKQWTALKVQLEQLNE